MIEDFEVGAITIFLISLTVTLLVHKIGISAKVNVMRWLLEKNHTVI